MGETCSFGTIPFQKLIIAIGTIFFLTINSYRDNSPENKLLIGKVPFQTKNRLQDNSFSESRLIIRTIRFRQIVIGTIPFQTISYYLDNFFPENELLIGTIHFEKENCLLGKFSYRQLAVFGTIPFDNLVLDNLMSLGQFLSRELTFIKAITFQKKINSNISFRQLTTFSGYFLSKLSK